jgi:hypothetical protein
MKEFVIILQLLSQQGDTSISTEHYTTYKYDNITFCQRWGNTLATNLNEEMIRYEVLNLTFSYRCVEHYEYPKDETKTD